MPHKDKKEGNACKNRNHHKVRLQVLTYYSGGDPKCACCDEKQIKFLALDHINGGGGKERKKSGYPKWYWLRKNGFPDGYQVLCHNCNLAKGFYGECPHKE